MTTLKKDHRKSSLLKILSLIASFLILLFSLMDLGQSVSLYFHFNTVGFPIDSYLVNSIEQNSPAQKAGLKEQDIITKVNNESASILLDPSIGKNLPSELSLSIERNSENKTLSVSLTPNEKLGIQFQQVQSTDFSLNFTQSAFRFLIFSIFKYAILIALCILNLYLIFKNKLIWKKLSVVLIVLTLISIIWSIKNLF